MKKNNKIHISIIGLGYVGLPLALEFGKKFPVIGFDLSKNRIKQLRQHVDVNLEIKKEDFKKSKNIYFSSNKKDIAKCNIYIITVPTPIKKNKSPDIQFVKKACNIVAEYLKKKDIVIFESTVFPGFTEEICVPILEKKSNLTYNKEFYCGYSPERINPGDHIHKLKNVVKITSGSNLRISNFVDKLYNKIIKAGTHKVSSIAIAEAAKVIENAQRDINIAFINELSIIFNTMKLDFNEILNAASTKWNFLNFQPGLVGGHCIGVDPYYLAYKSRKIGYNPKIILSGRKLNNSMGTLIAQSFYNFYINKYKKANNLKFLIMGLSFKENCVDIRNTLVIDIINSLKKYKAIVDIFDPIVDKKNVYQEYKLKLINSPKLFFYDGIIIAVGHNKFKKIGIQKIKNFGKKKSVIFDVKSIFDSKYSDLRL